MSLGKMFTDDFYGILDFTDLPPDINEIINDPSIMFDDDASSSEESGYSPQREWLPAVSDCYNLYENQVEYKNNDCVSNPRYVNEINNIDVSQFESINLPHISNEFDWKQQQLQNTTYYPNGCDITQDFYGIQKKFYNAQFNENKGDIRTMIIGGSCDKNRLPLVTSQTVEKKATEKKRNNAISKKVPCQPRQNKYKHRKTRDQPNKCYHLWDFLKDLLDGKLYADHPIIEWTDKANAEFRIKDTKALASKWGEKKGATKEMTYDKLSRTIRYYCTLDILKKIDGKRLQFKFSNGRMWTKGGS